MWFQRFIMYRDIGTDRTLLGTFNLHKRQEGNYQGDKHGNATSLPGSWTKATKKWQWVERARAYDDFLHHQRERERDKRRKELEDLEWTSALKMFDKTTKMLDWPLADREVEDPESGDKVLVKAAGWSQGTVPNMIKAASQLGRMALSMPTTGPNGLDPDRKGATDGDGGEYLDDAEIEWMHEYMEDPAEVELPTPPDSDA